MRSTSRGWIKLRSKNPQEHPIIQPNYLSTEIDRWEMRESVKLAREILAQPAFEDYCEYEMKPGIDVQSDEDIDAFVRENRWEKIVQNFITRWHQHITKILYIFRGPISMFFETI